MNFHKKSYFLSILDQKRQYSLNIIQPLCVTFGYFWSFFIFPRYFFGSLKGKIKWVSKVEMSQICKQRWISVLGQFWRHSLVIFVTLRNKIVKIGKNVLASFTLTGPNCNPLIVLSRVQFWPFDKKGEKGWNRPKTIILAAIVKDNWNWKNKKRYWFQGTSLETDNNRPK